MRKATTAAGAERLEQVPNVGPSLAADLRRVGVKRPADLVGRNGFELYDRLCAATGQRHDPCVIDVFPSAVAFMAGGPVRPWWDFTAERKRRLAVRARLGHG